MINHNEFHPNLERAQQGEREVADLLVKFADLTILNSNCDDKRWDIETLMGTDNKITFEVKEDLRCFGVEIGKESTGNIPVEYESRGQSSGIVTSKADVWIFRIWKDVDVIDHYMIHTKRLHEMIKQRMFRYRQKMRYTDSKNRLYMFRYQTIETNGMKL